jgi:hypothetical protein
VKTKGLFRKIVHPNDLRGDFGPEFYSLVNICVDAGCGGWWFFFQAALGRKGIME